MATGMTTQERIDDICAMSGLSEDIVRRVMDAERRSVVKSLKRGERANLIGRAVIRPSIKSKIAIGGDIDTYVKLSVSAAASLESLLADVKSFEVPAEPEDAGIILHQIPSLT